MLVLSLRVREGESNHVTLKTTPKRAKQFKRKGVVLKENITFQLAQIKIIYTIMKT